MEEKQVLTVRECAKALRISMKTLYKMLKEGKGPPYIKAGDKFLIPVSAFYRYLENAGCQIPK